MSKVIPLTKNHKNYDDVPDGLKWAIPIHECLESTEVKEASRILEIQAKQKVQTDFRKKNLKIIPLDSDEK